MAPQAIAWLAAGLLLVRWAAELALEALNRRHARAHAGAVPEAFRDSLSPETYAKSVEYTLAKSRFSAFELTRSTVITLVLLFSGLLPALESAWVAWLGTSVWAGAAGLVAVGALVSLASLPSEAWSQFRLEERFGFNTTTVGTWWMDRLKGAVLGILLGLPLLALLLYLFNEAGRFWWLWAWGALLAFQGILLVLAPVLILPLFNKFQPLPAGPLRDRLLKLAERTGFTNRGLEVMDGSRRSRHANAFFTGLGRFRKIVLFDTLIAQLGEEEVEAVLAHEIGHYRLRHVPKLLASSALLSLAGFGALAWLAACPPFFQAFGFEQPQPAIAFLLFGLLADAVTFWMSPLSNALARRFEYQADAYASDVVGSPQGLVGALRKLHTRNLSNLLPHPLYSGFHYSHPTLVEREAALLRPRPEAA